ncbi:MAG: tetraacyldisaccharide 4'-kinase [Rubripirellula sp.]|nr:tetraacyldisaccharide 4'-kinase [Rubripirellula sp.]
MSWDYRAVLSGKRKDPVAMTMRGGLRIASWFYRGGIAFRNHRYDRGTDVHDCGVPVISVGNLTTGGTGKTPIVCYLAKQLRQRGLRVALVSRGYGRGEADSNDEAMELHDRLPDVPHVQDPDRVEAARIAVEELGAEVILMDDGMQHRRLHRDLNLVVIDATCPFGFGYLLPRGLLREPVSELRRADLCILSRCDAVEQSTVEMIRQQIHDVASELPIVHSVHQPSGLLEYPDHITAIDRQSEVPVAVLTAIGNPQAFERTVHDCGMRIIDARHLPDHDSYSPETVRALIQWAQQLDGKVNQIVCTHKDLVKLRTDRLGGVPLRAIQIELEMTSGTDQLESVLSRIKGP